MPRSDMQTAHGRPSLPDRFETPDALDEFLSLPGEDLVRDMEDVEGDIIILGASGKMGPTLARLARNAAPGKRVVAVARFSEPESRQRMEDWGIETIQADLLDEGQVNDLPKLENVLFMAGMKFGASGNQPLTWAMNTYCPALVANAFRDSRIVAFSTGNVYPLIDVARQGATEDTPPGPRGEYAQSCLGRERIFEHFSRRHGTPGRLYRLNYAIDLRYGVLHDLATRLKGGQTIDLAPMAHVNVIWQGDANAQALRLLKHCTAPTSPINVSGPETLSVRWLVEELCERMGIAPRLTGEEPPSAWLSNSARAAKLFGYPAVPVSAMLDWVAEWVMRDMPSLNKPTKYEVRDGGF